MLLKDLKFLAACRGTIRIQRSVRCAVSSGQSYLGVINREGQLIRGFLDYRVSSWFCDWPQKNSRIPWVQWGANLSNVSPSPCHDRLEFEAPIQGQCVSYH